MDIRRLLIIKDRVSFEGGAPAAVPVTRVAACALIANPLAGIATDDLGVLVPIGAELGEYLIREAGNALKAPVIAYGKAAILERQAISSTRPRLFILAWESQCGRQLVAARLLFPLT